MKTELRIETIIHPELGELIKTYIYTYDEFIYNTLDEAIEVKGFENKEFYVEPPKIDISNIDLDSLTDEQIEKLKQRILK